MSGHYALLPYIEQQPLYNQFQAVNWNPWENGTPARKAVNEAQISYLNCPSATGLAEPTNSGRTRGISSYAFCAGDNYPAGQVYNGGTEERNDANLSGQKQQIKNRGVYGRSWPTLGEVSDGTSNTIGMGEFNRPSSVQSIGMPVFLTGAPNATAPLSCKAQWNGQKYLSTPFTGDTARGYRAWAGNPFFCAITTILPPNSPSCMIYNSLSNAHWMPGLWSAGSNHTGGAQVGLVDGSVHFISSSIDAGNNAIPAPTGTSGGISPYGVWGALGTARGGEPYANVSQ